MLLYKQQTVPREGAKEAEEVKAACLPHRPPGALCVRKTRHMDALTVSLALCSALFFCLTFAVSFYTPEDPGEKSCRLRSGVCRSTTSGLLRPDLRSARSRLNTADSSLRWTILSFNSAYT